MATDFVVFIYPVWPHFSWNNKKNSFFTNKKNSWKKPAEYTTSSRLLNILALFHVWCRISIVSFSRKFPVSLETKHASQDLAKPPGMKIIHKNMNTTVDLMKCLDNSIHCQDSGVNLQIFKRIWQKHTYDSPHDHWSWGDDVDDGDDD